MPRQLRAFRKQVIDHIPQPMLLGRTQRVHRRICVLIGEHGVKIGSVFFEKLDGLESSLWGCYDQRRDDDSDEIWISAVLQQYSSNSKIFAAKCIKKWNVSFRKLREFVGILALF